MSDTPAANEPPTFPWQMPEDGCFQESKETAMPSRQAYQDAISRLASERIDAAWRARDAWFQPVATPPTARDASLAGYRDQLRRHLGWPLVDAPARQATLQSQELLGSDSLGSYYRLTIEAMPGVPLYGILALPPGPGPHPLMIGQHGGAGTPELTLGLYGNTHNYHGMSRRLLRRGYAVFAPQLLLWAEHYGSSDGSVKRIARPGLQEQLVHAGSSTAALEIHLLQGCLDVLATRPELNISRCGMAGLSYGGFYTLFTAAIETRIRTAFVSGIFQDGRQAEHLSDMRFPHSAERFGFAEVAALIAPRRLYVEHGRNDPVVPFAPAEQEAARATRHFERLGLADRFSFHPHDFAHDVHPTSDHWLDVIDAELRA